MIIDSTALYHKYKNTKIQEIYEIILQWYLVSIGYRNVALVYVESKSILEKIMRFLKKNNISYRIFEKDLVLFNPKKFNIDELDISKEKISATNWVIFTHALQTIYQKIIIAL